MDFVSGESHSGDAARDGELLFSKEGNAIDDEGNIARGCDGSSTFKVELNAGFIIGSGEDDEFGMGLYGGFNGGGEGSAPGSGREVGDGAVLFLEGFYGVGSEVDGPGACRPAGNLAGQMFVGVWDVDGNGNGKLSATNIAHTNTGVVEYVPLSDIGTISVRLVTKEGDVSATDHRPSVVVLCGAAEAE